MAVHREVLKSQPTSRIKPSSLKEQPQQLRKHTAQSVFSLHKIRALKHASDAQKGLPATHARATWNQIGAKVLIVIGKLRVNYAKKMVIITFRATSPQKWQCTEVLKAILQAVSSRHRIKNSHNN